METLRFALKLLAELVPLFLLISTVVYATVDSLTPARIQALLAGRSRWIGVPFAALLGALTPFCSCSTVPLVNGMRRAGIPLVIMVTFLIASPLINPVAVGLLWTAIGPEYAALYTASALVIAMAGAVLVGSWYREPAAGQVAAGGVRGALAVLSAEGPGRGATRLSDRLASAFARSLADLRKLWVPLVLAVVVGALIRGQAPAGLLARLAGPDAVWAVPVAALLGLPVYASVLILVPLGSTLLAQGVGVGVVTAFLMGASGFSLPEGILLSRVLPRPLLVRVLAVFTVAVVGIGYGFQWWLG